MAGKPSWSSVVAMYGLAVLVVVALVLPLAADARRISAAQEDDTSEHKTILARHKRHIAAPMRGKCGDCFKWEPKLNTCRLLQRKRCLEVHSRGPKHIADIGEDSRASKRGLYHGIKF